MQAGICTALPGPIGRWLVVWSPPLQRYAECWVMAKLLHKVPESDTFDKPM